MPSAKFPRVEWLAETNMHQHYRHGIAISLVRGLAALEVAAAHVRAQMYPSLKSLPDPTLLYQALSFFTGFAHQAVVVFFLLSGWLVGGSLLNKLHEPDAIVSYAIDRITRLWIVLIPAFLLTLILAIVDGTVDPRRLDLSSAAPYSGTAFLGNLLGVQDMLVPRYGGNFALWSLAYESWYYVLFPCLVLAWAGRSMASRIAAAVAALVAAWLLEPAIVMYFSLWLMGAACSRVRIDAPAHWFALAILLLAVVSVYFRLTGSNDILVEESFAQDMVFSATVLLVLCCLQSPANLHWQPTRIAARLGERLAAFSFTLYVIHVPVLLAIREQVAALLPAGRLDPGSARHLAIYLGMLAALILAAWLFHLPFEAQTTRLRRWMHGLRTSRRRKATAPA
jgi:peptidoglycan/LPS O-acetylase OafA/YrhL